MDATTPLLDALAWLGLASGVARSSVAYALVSASHVLGIALLIGPIALADLSMLGLVRGFGREGVATLRKAARLGLALAAATGLLLISTKPFEYAANPALQAKLVVIALGVANAVAFEWRWRQGREAFCREAAGASLACWLAALLLGRWIAFV